MTKNRVLAIIGTIISVVLAIVSIYFLAKICRFDVLPGKHLALVTVILIVLFLGVVIGQYFRIANIIADVIGFAVIVVLIIASVYIKATTKTIENLGHGDTKDIAIEVIVPKEFAGTDVKALAGTKIGISRDKDYNRYYVDVMKDISKDAGVEVECIEYEDNISMAKALLDKEVGAILLTSALTATVDDVFQSMSEEDEGFLGFNDAGEPIAFTDKVKTIKIYTKTVKNEEHGNVATITAKPTEHVTMDTSQIPFIVYVSGIDVTGHISTVSRSDVNVLVAINPATKQIAMITTPRDSYVEIPGITDGSSYRDKLTHAGLYGTACSASIATLENIYGVEINYYLRVNFTSVVDIVDLLGGVSVYSATDFTERWDEFHFSKGYNNVNGTQALHFARERYRISGGDYARGRNHTELIKAILNKAMSPSIITNYLTLLDTLQDNIETNFTTEEIAALVKMQLDDGAEWNFVSYCTEGINHGQQEMRYCYSYTGAKLCVTILDEESVAGASDLIEKVLNGEIITQEDAYTESTFNL